MQSPLKITARLPYLSILLAKEHEQPALSVCDCDRLHENPDSQHNSQNANAFHCASYLEL